MEAYEDAISETSTAWAPWFIVPADRKWVRNVAVSRVLVATLMDMDPRIPEPTEPIDATQIV
jgi:polyphosphate kinase 2 (PPK2 family)